MKFKECFLVEMPWIHYGDDKLFDLETEKHPKHQEIVDIIRNVLRGKKYTDKYGSVIQLKTDKDKKGFVKALRNDVIFQNQLKSIFKDIKKDIEKLEDTFK